MELHFSLNACTSTHVIMFTPPDLTLRVSKAWNTLKFHRNINSKPRNYIGLNLGCLLLKPGKLSFGIKFRLGLK